MSRASPVNGDPAASAPAAGRARTGARLEVTDLAVSLGRGGPDVVSEVCFSVRAGQVLGLVGESRSGKTTVGLALLRHTRRGVSVTAGPIAPAAGPLRRRCPPPAPRRRA